MSKYFYAATFILFFAANATAQMPQLTVDGKSNNGVQLQVLKIDVQVCGTVARTTWQMTFRNTTSRILEGSLNFPLKDGLSVSRYALDINGKMREAVPVDRSKGTEVFETIERRRVDPGLLEKVDGNNFRTRIYPINPHSTRTVLIGYEEELRLTANNVLHYYLPLHLQDTVAGFSLDVSVIKSAIQPVFDSSLNENIQFNSKQNLYIASFKKTDYVPRHSLSFSIPKPQDAVEVMLQEFENKYYYLINTTLQKNEREKVLPNFIGLLWDASLSGSNRNTKKEMELLDAYFKKINNLSVNLVVFSNTIKKSQQFVIRQGNWDSLKLVLEAVQYDGSTNFGNLDLKKMKVDEFILVSDGQQTLANKEMQWGGRPVYCINSAVSADYSHLKFIAGKTAGLVIDLQSQPVAEALKKLIHEPFRFLGIKQNSFIKENYPSLPVTVDGNFSAAGIATEGVQEIVLQFGYGNRITFEKAIAINTETQLCENFDIVKVYAQKKIAELDIQYAQNKQEIESMGRQYGLVTRNTSLIVLETVNDYVLYDIEPPAELRDEYERIMKQRRGDVVTKNKHDLESSWRMMETLKQWYGTATEKTAKLEKPKVVTTSTPVRNPGTQQTQARGLIPAPTGETKTVTGTIKDKDGMTISSVSVKIKGTNRGTMADANGNYSIRVRTGDVLGFHMVGFNTVEARVGSQPLLNAVLQKSSEELSEVVVTSAFGIKRTARSTSASVQTISGDEINVTQQANVNEALAGKVAGAQVRSQSVAKLGSASTVRLRGENGFGMGSGTLYVMDGVIMPTGADINSDDIKEFFALEGPVAAALFGPDGSNGAVIITTKNFQPDSAYRKMQDKITTENKIAAPPFDVSTFDYIKAIKQTEKAGRYTKYLELRQYYSSKPTYFFEVATYLLKTGDRENGLTVLTSLAELENSNYELYKMLGYKLKEAGDYEAELAAFKKVLDLRPADPQSYRDCALAHADLGNYQQALDMLYEGMTKSYSTEMNRMYYGIEEIFLTEINRLIALYKNKLDLKHIDKKLIVPMPSDVRVVMNWNKNNTDIDLWVTDPNAEKCYYSHKTTQIGGRISDDFTEGFGPEQFMLKTGVKGKYKIQINYFGDNQVTIAGPTTIMAEIYLYYGTSREQKRIVTLQMEKGRKGEVFIGEVEL